MLVRITSCACFVVIAAGFFYHAFLLSSQALLHRYPRRASVAESRPSRQYTATDADYPDIPGFVPLEPEENVRPNTFRRPEHGPFRRAEQSPLDRRSKSSPGYVRAPVKRSKANVANFTSSEEAALNATVVRRKPRVSPAVARRSPYQWGWSHLIDYQGDAYLIELDIGTPAQNTNVFIDTGSYELWVDPTCTNSANTAYCQGLGSYNPKRSSSAKLAGGFYNVSYGTGSVNSAYWTDTMLMSMEQIPSVKFAVASQSVYAWAGIMGLGYGYPYTIDYPNVVDLLVTDGMINAPIFSIDVGSEGNGDSEIIFGGINVYKFYGNLTAVPVWPPISEQDPAWLQYWINVTSVGMTEPDTKPFLFTNHATFVMPVLIDTGSTLSYFRGDLVALIAQQLNAEIDQYGNFVINCTWASTTTTTIDFGFNRGEVVISIAVKDFMWEEAPGYCLMGAQPADSGATNYVLGDSFIRAAYLVFDQQADIIWMAEYFNCGEGVLTIGSSLANVDPVPGRC